MENNPISPVHYKKGKREAILIIKDMLTREEFKGFCKGLITKYLIRADYKNGVEDLKKAEWYLKYLIKEEEKK
jgi:hypothetical protein